MRATHPSCVAVDAALSAAGVPGSVRILATPAPTARAAAEQLGCPVGAVANSLVFVTNGDAPLLIVTSGAHRVDLDWVASLLGTSITKAAPEAVRRHTGQPIGGVAPVGHPAVIRTLVDHSLAAYETLWAAGGIPHAVFPVSYPDLLRLTGGQEVDVQPGSRPCGSG